MTNSKTKKIEFNKEKHEYLLDGQRMTGCTTILGVLAKPALIPWAARMATDYIRENAPKEPLSMPDGEKPEEYNYIVNEKLLEEARKAHTKRKEKAGDYGTKTHEIIAEIIADVIENSEGFIRSGRNSNKSVQNFLDWAIKNEVKFLETEKIIYSEDLFVAGTVDFVCEIDEQIWIGDFKTTGSGIYAEHFYQCAGYQIMLNAMDLYPNITGYLILNLKEDGEFLEKRSVSNEKNKKIFLNCLEIYRQTEKLKSNIN